MLKEQSIGLDSTDLGSVMRGKFVCSWWVMVTCFSRGNLLKDDYILHQTFLSVPQGFNPWGV